MNISFKRSTMVKPAARTPNSSMWISNVDEVMNSYHATSLYIYRPTGVAHFFNPAVLKEALSRALVAFYPAAGRLSRDNNGRIEIKCNGEGVLFVEAESNGTVDDLGDFTFKVEMDGNVVPIVDYSQGISTFPLVLFQVTHFKCGGVSLGTAMEHHLSDGKAAIHFINTWANLARGLEITLLPIIDRAPYLAARSPPRPQFDHVEYHPPPPLKSTKPSLTNKTFSILKLSCEHLNTLKALCIEQKNKKLPETPNYTSFAVLAAHIWRCACKARGLDDDQETRVRIPVDGRTRLRPPLPEGYFGNVIFPATSVALSGEVQSKPLRDVADVICGIIAQMDDEYLRSSLDYLELVSDHNTVAAGEHSYNCPSIGINSWARLPVYEADFGWGRPIHMGPGAVPSEGKCIMLQNPENDGSLLLAVSLPKEHMKLFEMFLYDI